VPLHCHVVVPQGRSVWRSFFTCYKAGLIWKGQHESNIALPRTQQLRSTHQADMKFGNDETSRAKQGISCRSLAVIRFDFGIQQIRQAETLQRRKVHSQRANHPKTVDAQEKLRIGKDQ